jgi:hypothetical protein
MRPKDFYGRDYLLPGDLLCRQREDHKEYLLIVHVDDMNTPQHRVWYKYYATWPTDLIRSPALTIDHMNDSAWVLVE